MAVSDWFGSCSVHSQMEVPRRGENLFSVGLTRWLSTLIGCSCESTSLGVRQTARGKIYWMHKMGCCSIGKPIPSRIIRIGSRIEHNCKWLKRVGDYKLQQLHRFSSWYIRAEETFSLRRGMGLSWIFNSIRTPSATGLLSPLSHTPTTLNGAPCVTCPQEVGWNFHRFLPSTRLLIPFLSLTCCSIHLEFAPPFFTAHCAFRKRLNESFFCFASATP